MREQKEKWEEPSLQSRKIILTGLRRQIGKNPQAFNLPRSPITVKKHLQRAAVSAHFPLPLFPPACSSPAEQCSTPCLHLFHCFSPSFCTPAPSRPCCSSHFSVPFLPFHSQLVNPLFDFSSPCFRFWMMAASVTRSPISPCSLRIWTPCQSVGPLTLTVPWWWVFTGNQHSLGTSTWVSQSTTLGLTSDLCAHSVSRGFSHSFKLSFITL